MEAEHTGNLQAGLSDRSQPFDHFDSIGDQRRQAACGAGAAMRFDNASYPSLRWLVIEKNSPTPVDLDVYESWCKDNILGQVR
jgi:hypothetical protein